MLLIMHFLSAPKKIKTQNLIHLGKSTVHNTHPMSLSLCWGM